MTNEENAEMTSHLATFEFFKRNEVIVNQNGAFKDAVAEFITNYEAEKEYGAILATDNTNLSKEKSALKAKMIEHIVELTGYAFVALNKAGKTQDAEQLDINPTDYAIADIDAYDLAKANLQLLKDQTAIITPNYVTVDDLKDLEADIEAFIEAKGDTQDILKTTPAQRAAFKDALAKTKESVDDIRILGKKFEKTNNLFYDELMRVTTVVLTNVAHTSLSMSIIGKDGKPVAGATASLSNSKKTATSDAKGYLKIDEIRNGKTTITITSPTHKEYMQEVRIVRGKENHVEVVMEG
jgi:hypothetical protein